VSVLLNSGADGLMLGLVYGLAAMGLSLIWGVMRVINLSHGAAVVSGMFGVFLVSSTLNINPYLSLVIVAAAGLALVYFGLFNHDFSVNALQYAGAVERGTDLFHPNHLLPNALHRVVYAIATTLGSGTRAIWLMQALSVGAGILAAAPTLLRR